MKHICILGEGAWGTAIATVLADNGHRVHLWCYDPKVTDSIKKNRTTRYAPDIILHESIIPYTNMADAIEHAEIIFEAIPILYLRSVLEQAKKYYRNQPWVILSKGIEQHSLLLPSALLEEVIDQPVVSVMSGPSFAHDLIRKQPTAMVLATHHQQHAREIQQLMNNEYLHLFYSPDIVGVQLGGALKNIISLGIGILDGAGYADNTKAWFFTQGLQEMVRFAEAMGAERETLYGLSGLGDLVLTAMGNHSKNYSVGRRIGAGESLSSIMNNVHTMPEGINTIQSAQQLIQKKNLDLPLIRGIYQVIFEQKDMSVVKQILVEAR